MTGHDSTSTFVHGKVLLVPVYHSRITFARVVREAFHAFKPDRVAVELPPDLESGVFEAVRRLPFLSLVGYSERDDVPAGHIVPAGQDEQGEPAFTVRIDPRYTFVPVHPGDPIIEAIRLAKEHGKPVDFIDTIVDGYVPLVLDMPDEEAIEHLSGFDEFKDMVVSMLETSERGSVDHDREICMASRLLELASRGFKVMCVLGFQHYRRVAELLEGGKGIEVIETFVHEDQVLFNVDPLSSDLVIEEIPYFEYLYELSRRLGGKAAPPGLDSEIGQAKVLFFQLADPSSEEEEVEDTLKPARATHVDDRWYNVLQETTAMELALLERLGAAPCSRKVALQLLFSTVGKIYEDYYARTPVPRASLSGLGQYLRNWAALRDKLVPTLDQVALAAKGFINDEYASIVLDIARMYPFIDPDAPYPTVRHDAESQLRGAGNILLRSKYPRKQRSWMQLPIKRRPKEKFPGEWQRAWARSHGLCSFPPEDLKEETFFNQLRARTLSMLEERRVKIHEFTSSLLDGVDFRETMRKKLESKIMVREIVPVIGKAGSVVIIFDEDDRDPEKFTSKLTWWAEHGQESDMAFYASHPEEHLVGPGIARIELGGVVSIFPPRHVPEIWDYFQEEASMFKKHEILALAGIVFSSERFVPHVSINPPSKRLEQVATEHGRVLVHVPFWKLSSETIEFTRYLHVLASKEVRRYAKDYIFL